MDVVCTVFVIIISIGVAGVILSGYHLFKKSQELRDQHTEYSLI